VSRRGLLITGVTVLLAAAGAALGLLVIRDGHHSPRLAGRIAVVDGCGLRHMWPDGSDQRRLCLSDIWASASLSFDGRKLAWDTKASSAFGVLVADADAQNEYVLQLPLGANVEPSLSPDGKRLAFLHSPADDGRYDVWATSTDDSSDVAEQVTAVRDVSFVAWSPSGDWLAYVEDGSQDTREGTIALSRPDGDEERLLGRGGAPSWAPDGKRIAFVRGGNVWTSALDGSQQRLLIRNGSAPAWSRDGDQIAFMREEKCGRPACRERLFLAFSDGGNPHAVGPTFRAGRRLLWLPDPNE
jgi:dipeptidyl aminopeptidase/acylaminoacyl peptidase